MKYNSQIHHRRSIRLEGYDYAQAGAYFITICCHNKTQRFGTITIDPKNMDVQMVSNDFGQIAYNEWIKLPELFLNVSLDVSQIMPNHMHGIIVLNTVDNGAGASPDNKNFRVDNGAGASPDNKNFRVDNGAGASPDNKNFRVDNGAGASPAPTIGNIVGAYKSLVANGCLDLFKCSMETSALPNLNYS